MVRSTNGSERPRQIVLSTALAMTEAAYLEARQRTYGNLIDEGNPDLRECGENRTRQHRPRSLLGLRRELAGQDLPINPQGA